MQRGREAGRRRKRWKKEDRSVWRRGPSSRRKEGRKEREDAFDRAIYYPPPPYNRVSERERERFAKRFDSSSLPLSKSCCCCCCCCCLKTFLCFLPWMVRYLPPPPPPIFMTSSDIVQEWKKKEGETPLFSGSSLTKMGRKKREGAFYLPPPLPSTPGTKIGSRRTSQRLHPGTFKKGSGEGER